MKCYHCKHYNLENGICDMDLCEIIDPWENVDCEYLYEEKMTILFHQITQSPEVLAEKLVYTTLNAGRWEWCSTILPDKSFETRAEAITVTVAKLKEVCDEL